MDIPTEQHVAKPDTQVVVITGGAGTLCATLSRTMAVKGMKIAILDIKYEAANLLAREINQAGGVARAFTCDVSNKASLSQVSESVMHEYGHVDVLINGAGGNSPQATTGVDLAFFDLPESAISWVLELNLVGTILSSQIFGRIMANQKKGTILNISSMNALRPLTRIPAYSAAKAAVSNFTQWLAVHMAQEYSPEIRVNAIAPGFFLTDQNRYLLIDPKSGELSERGQAIINHTPLRRFGTPEDLVSTVLWLISPASSFITGIVVPIDGGFSAYSGV
jgi:NAD(P)-dependent dehydrogenase (short-subunit alcohol dehydrogenase family)